MIGVSRRGQPDDVSAQTRWCRNTVLTWCKPTRGVEPRTPSLRVMYPTHSAALATRPLASITSIDRDSTTLRDAQHPLRETTTRSDLRSRDAIDAPKAHSPHTPHVPICGQIRADHSQRPTRPRPRRSQLQRLARPSRFPMRRPELPAASPSAPITVPDHRSAPCARQSADNGLRNILTMIIYRVSPISVPRSLRHR